jgi:hypothetical protein
MYLYQTTWHHILDDITLCIHHGKLKSQSYMRLCSVSGYGRDQLKFVTHPIWFKKIKFPLLC